MSAFAAALLSLMASPFAHAQGEPWYEAAFADGTRVEGKKLTGWHGHNTMPHLQGVRLRDERRQLLWLRNRGLTPHNPSGNDLGFVEFVGQDRLVGRVIGIQAAAATDSPHVPAHLLVKRPPPLTPVRILPARIQRVVWGRSSRDRLRPGTLYYRNGRQLRFLSLRWRRDSVVLLLGDETREVQLSGIAEVHLPHIDPWQAYYRELAVLSPACRSRLIRFETIDGLIVTGSQLRFRATAYASPADKLRAAGLVKHLDAQITSAQAQRGANQTKLDQARAEYPRQVAALASQKKAAQQASQKATAEMRQRIDGQRKADAAQRAKKREQLEREFRAADEAMQKRLAKVPAEKRGNALSAFRGQQTQSRKTREKSLEDARLRFDKQKQAELEQFTAGQTAKLAQHEKQLQAQVAAQKRRLDEETGRWQAYLRHVESLRAKRAAAPGEHGDPGSWHHMVQPVWSVDPMWVPFRRIHTRWSFAPGQVPLARVYPAATAGPSLLPWYVNRNSHGQLLRSAGREYGWGFAVHAYSELSFALPQCAVSFRGRVGLDRLAAAGGCVRTRIYVGSTRTKPVYAGPLLVGSKKVVDTGRVRLPWPAEGPKRLILQVDPANHDHPSGADPLNIRDMLDWLDPRLELDTGKLQDLVLRQVGPVMAASPGWTVRLDKRGVCTWTSHLDETARRGAGRCVTMLQAKWQPLALSREMTIGPADKWLAAYVGLPTGEDPRPDTVALHVGERRIQPRRVPLRQRWRSRPVPLLFPLAEYQGRKITLELRQPANEGPLHWQAVRTLPAPSAAYRLADILARGGKRDVQITHDLAQTLLSDWISDRHRRAVLKIGQLGGLVNFTSPIAGEVAPNTLANVMIGSDWTGGDEALPTLRELPDSITLFVTEDSGVSAGAIGKLRAAMPKLTIKTMKRTPSLKSGRRCIVTWRNHCHQELIVLFIDELGGVHFSRHLTPGQTMRRIALHHNRFEAHIRRKDYTDVKQYVHTEALSRFLVTPNAVWDLKPRGR